MFVSFQTYKHFEVLHADFAHTNSFMTGSYETIAKGIDKRIYDFEVRSWNFEIRRT